MVYRAIRARACLTQDADQIASSEEVWIKFAAICQSIIVQMHLRKLDIEEAERRTAGFRWA